MPRATDRQSLIHAVVTPRFEVFYALHALESGAGEHLNSWRREMERLLPARLRTSLANVAPTPLIWPLLADALRGSPPAVTYREMIATLQEIDERTFQTFVLSGVFKSPGSVDRLVSGTTSLNRTVAGEARTQEKLLTVLGLFPFNKESPSAIVFERIVSAPGAYRDEVVGALESFWSSGFEDTWRRLEPGMKDHAKAMRMKTTRRSFADFARDRKLPLALDGDSIVTVRSGVRHPVESADGIYLVPSAFNTAGLWAAYSDARGRMRFFIPMLDSTLISASAPKIDPALVFRALGDTTRYAIAASIARTPMTSVELARVFGVSKPTISHHVQAMRAAGLLEESQTENGIQLSLNRRALEELSSTAVRELFSGDERVPVVKRSRRSNKITRAS